MSAVDDYFRRIAGKPSEGLGGFDKRERDDLGLHVDHCAQRYDDLRWELGRVKRLLWLVIGLLASSNVIDFHAIAQHWIYGK